MPYAIRGARLFDGERADLLIDPVIVVDGDRIAAVGTQVPEGMEVTDLGDVTLLPGLVDVHVHLCFDGSLEPVAHLAAASDEEVLDVMRAAGRTALAAGITTVRDLGDRNYLSLRLRDETAADPTAGPHVVAAGPPITTAKGHCWYLGGEADGVDGVRAAVREHAAKGVDVIKVMTSGGELTPGTHSHEASYSREELEAIVDEAHRLDLPVTGHAHATEAIINAVAAGFDSIEHCTFMTEEGIDDRPDVLDAIREAGTTVSATLGMKPGAPPPPRIAARIAGLVEGFGRMYERGIPIVVSSDCGIGPQKPYDILPQAAQMYATFLDIPTIVALRAVTSAPARLCRLGDRKGRLAPGYDADILAVAGNPVADIAALQQTRAVYRMGRAISPRSS